MATPQPDRTATVRKMRTLHPDPFHHAFRPEATSGRERRRSAGWALLPCRRAVYGAQSCKDCGIHGRRKSARPRGRTGAARSLGPLGTWSRRRSALRLQCSKLQRDGLSAAFAVSCRSSRVLLAGAGRTVASSPGPCQTWKAVHEHPDASVRRIRQSRRVDPVQQ